MEALLIISNLLIYNTNEGYPKLDHIWVSNNTALFNMEKWNTKHMEV